MARFYNASTAATSSFIPLPSFLTYAQGRAALPTLNTNFGWDSNGLWFGPTVADNISDVSYPVFTNFTIPDDVAVFVSFDFVIEEGSTCSDIGMAIYVDGETPNWAWEPDLTRIAAQFDCPVPELSGRTSEGVLEEGDVNIPAPGTYRFLFFYDPNAETQKVGFGYGTTDLENFGADLFINEALPAGDYRIGFASDNDGIGGDGGNLSPRSYISNLEIVVGYGGGPEETVTYQDSLTNGNSFSGGTANTGDITFNGVQIIGAGTASGDGGQYGTIDLVPDADLITNQYGHDQYLIIDPTGPNHIHIRAGGEQDESSANLFLGAERNNVYVSDGARQVVVTTRPSIIENTYVNDSLTSSATFVTSNASDIGVGYVVNVGGSDYIVDEVANDVPVEGLLSVAASGASFTAGASYVFTYNPTWNNVWEFSSDGYLYGPAMGGLFVDGLLNGEGNLWLSSSDSVVLNGNEGGEFLGDSDVPGNQIATIGDISSTVSEETAFTVAGGTLGTQPTFTGAPLFSGSYVKVGNLVHFQIQVDMDNITNFGTGQYYVDLPFPAKYSYHFRDACLHDNSGTVRQYALSGHVYAGQSQVTLWFTSTSGQDELFDYNSPALLTVSDNFHISGTYITAS